MTLGRIVSIDGAPLRSHHEASWGEALTVELLQHGWNDTLRRIVEDVTTDVVNNYIRNGNAIPATDKGLAVLAAEVKQWWNVEAPEFHPPTAMIIAAKHYAGTTVTLLLWDDPFVQYGDLIAKARVAL